MMDEQKPLASIRQRTTGKLPLLILILLAMNFSMGFMYLLIKAGAPWWLTIAALVGTMFLTIYLLSQKAEYRIFNHGLEEKVSPLSGKLSLRGSRVSVYEWKDLEFYTDGEDLTRAMWVKPYLKLKFKNHRQLQVYASFKEDVPALRAFIAVFLEVMVAQSQMGPSTTINPAQQPITNAKAAAPLRKPSFYERPIAKFVAAFFVVVCSIIIAIAVTRPEIVSPTSMYRIEAVMIPGTLYLIYRSFGRK